MKNKQGIELKAGMRVKGFINYQRSYMRLGEKNIVGTIVALGKRGKLFVNSDADPEKNYPLQKFAHDFLTDEKTIWLEVTT